MFYLFILGVAIFIALAVFMSVRKSSRFSGMYLSENELVAGRARFPFNILMLYFVFIVSVFIISLGQMYNQQRYIYYLMPLFILVFSYMVFVISMAAGSFCRFILRRFKRFSNESVESAFTLNKSSGTQTGKMQSGNRMTLKNITAAIITVIFVIVSFFTISGIDLKETLAIPAIRHTDKLNTLYSISTVNAVSLGCSSYRKLCV